MDAKPRFISPEAKALDYVRRYRHTTDLHDLTNALSQHGKAEIIDAFRKRDAQRYFDACDAAVTEALELECHEDNRDELS